MKILRTLAVYFVFLALPFGLPSRLLPMDRGEEVEMQELLGELGLDDDGVGSAGVLPFVRALKDTYFLIGQDSDGKYSSFGGRHRELTPQLGAVLKLSQKTANFLVINKNRLDEDSAITAASGYRLYFVNVTDHAWAYTGALWQEGEFTPAARVGYAVAYGRWSQRAGAAASKATVKKLLTWLSKEELLDVAKGSVAEIERVRGLALRRDFVDLLASKLAELESFFPA